MQVKFQCWGDRQTDGQRSSSLNVSFPLRRAVLNNRRYLLYRALGSCVNVYYDTIRYDMIDSLTWNKKLSVVINLAYVHNQKQK